MTKRIAAKLRRHVLMVDILNLFPLLPVVTALLMDLNPMKLFDLAQPETILDYSHLESMQRAIPMIDISGNEGCVWDSFRKFQRQSHKPLV